MAPPCKNHLRTLLDAYSHSPQKIPNCSSLASLSNGLDFIVSVINSVSSSSMCPRYLQVTTFSFLTTINSEQSTKEL